MFGVPLGGEQSVEVCAAGVAWYVLCGENIRQDVVALAAGLVLAHQLGLEKGGPTALQSLHPSHIGLSEAEKMSLAEFIQGDQSVSQSITDQRHWVTLQTRATLGTLTLV